MSNTQETFEGASEYVTEEAQNAGEAIKQGANDLTETVTGGKGSSGRGEGFTSAHMMQATRMTEMTLSRWKENRRNLILPKPITGTQTAMTTLEEDTKNLSLEDIDTAGAATLWICEVQGHDTEGSGTEKMPFKTLLRAIEAAGGAKANFVVRKDLIEGFQPAAKAAIKKAVKMFEVNVKKAQKAAAAAAEAAAEALKNAAAEQARIEEAKKIVLVEDASLPAALQASIKIRDTTAHRGRRVKISGWVHRLRVQGKDIMFIVLRDGSGFLQCVLNGKMCHTFDALTLTVESTVTIHGVLQEVPAGKSAPGGHELICDFWSVIGKAPGGDEAFGNKLNTVREPAQYCDVESSNDILLDQRHLVIRGEIASSVLRVRSHLMKAFRSFFESRFLTEVSPPLMAYLTQSSQLYLETCLASIGDVYCMVDSFRAEKSLTRRHLSEFTHCEAELAFISFDDLMNFVEDMIVSVVDAILDDPVCGQIVKDLNPDFKRPKKPFKRMQYIDAIKWLNDHGIKKDILNENGDKIGEADYEYGEDIPESPERRMTDTIGEPILLNRFPAEIKSFYMKRCGDDRRLTESVDLLMPNVGEIVGGSMRISDL
eukprot:jgi/Hompol1/2006/HPOL_005310-RA